MPASSKVAAVYMSYAVSIVILLAALLHLPQVMGADPLDRGRRLRGSGAVRRRLFAHGALLVTSRSSPMESTDHQSG